MSNTLFGAVIGTLIFLCILEHWFYKRRRKRKIAEMEARWEKLGGAFRLSGTESGRWSSKDVHVGVDLAKPGSERTVYRTDFAEAERKVAASLGVEAHKDLIENKPYYHDDCCSCDDPSH